MTAVAGSVKEVRLLGLVAFRRWNLGEYVRQLDGDPPTAWSGPTRP